MDRFLSCNGLGISPSQLITEILKCNSQQPEWFRFEDRDVYFTYQGRYAVGLICRLWNIGPGDEVLVPAYNCGAEIDPFIRAGARAILYRISDQCELDIEDIINRITPVTKIVYVTHFFGWPQETRELAEWCKGKGIFLVEDCAQALFSNGPENTIAQIGDAVIYSFVKSLPTPDGGALVIKNDSWKENHRTKQPYYRETLHANLVLLKKWFMHRNNIWQRYEILRSIIAKSQSGKTAAVRNEMHPEMLKSNYFENRKKDWGMSRIARGILNKADSEHIVKIRRRNYKYLHDRVRDLPSIKVLFDDLPDNVCPLSFPLYFENRKSAYQQLGEKGVLVQGWPGYYPGFNWDDYPEACNLKDNLLTLPVHQDLEIRHMEYLSECVKFIADRSYVEESKHTL